MMLLQQCDHIVAKVQDIVTKLDEEQFYMCLVT